MTKIKVTEKECKDCKETKAVSEFYSQKANKSGFKFDCKTCFNQKNSKYRKSVDGVITGIYGNQRAGSKKRGHKMPTYSKQELTTWLYKNDFKKLYKKWIMSGCDRWMKPSVDRLNDFKGYSFDNIQLVTWKINKDKAHMDQYNANGTGGLRCKAVNQSTKDGLFVAKHDSQRIAERVSGISSSNISLCCSGKRSTAGGFVWSYG